MPQLIAEDWAPQLIWLAITFIGLYLVMARVALPRIGSIIEQRRDRIAHDIDQAGQLKAQAEQAIAAYETSLAEARARAHGIAQETRGRLNAETERQRTDLEATLADKTREAERKIAEAKTAAMAQIREVAAETAETIVERLIGGTVAKDRVADAVTRVLAR